MPRKRWTGAPPPSSASSMAEHIMHRRTRLRCSTILAIIWHMRTALASAAAAVLISAAALAQPPDKLAFEVASVKPSEPIQPGARVFFGPPRGGPGTKDPARITWTNAALLNVLMTAYDVPIFQINAPAWLSTSR